MLTSLAVLATGVALLFVGPSASGTLRELHKASFIAWVAVTTLHVVGHLPDLHATFVSRRGGRLEYNRMAAGRAGRTIALAGAIVAGVVLAIVLIPTSAAGLTSRRSVTTTIRGNDRNAAPIDATKKHKRTRRGAAAAGQGQPLDGGGLARAHRGVLRGRRQRLPRQDRQSERRDVLAQASGRELEKNVPRWFELAEAARASAPGEHHPGSIALP